GRCGAGDGSSWGLRRWVRGWIIRPGQPSVDLQRRLVEGGQLLPQLQDMVRPEAGLAEPGEGQRKGWILPAPPQPGGEVHQPQGAQRLDQADLPQREVAE